MVIPSSQTKRIHRLSDTPTLDGSDREITLAGKDIDSLRLAYAQHVYRQQGATVERSVVLTGGWQTSKESAYVQATRARHGTDWHLARDQLGEEGQDPDRITRLAERMGQQPSTHAIHRLPRNTPTPSGTPHSTRSDELTPHMGWLDQISERETYDLKIDLEH